MLVGGEEHHKVVGVEGHHKVAEEVARHIAVVVEEEHHKMTAVVSAVVGEQEDRGLSYRHHKIAIEAQGDTSYCFHKRAVVEVGQEEEECSLHKSVVAVVVEEMGLGDNLEA